MNSAPPLPPLPEARTSPQAIWSLTLGILSNTCLWLLGSIPAIILGIVAMRKIDASAGAQKGRGLAIAGIVTGGVGFFGGLFPISIAAAILLPSFTAVQDQAEATKEKAQVRQVYVACRQYEAEFGQLPRQLGELIPDFIPSDDLIHIEGDAGERLALLYRTGMTAADDPEQPLIAGPRPYRRGRVVARVSGEVGLVPEADFQAAMAAKFPAPQAGD